MNPNLFPETITKKWLAIELGYYHKKKSGEVVSCDRLMWKHIYTDELIEDVLGLTVEQFKRIRKFNTIQTRKIIKHLFET